MPSFETVIYGKIDGVAEIRLNRPDRLNAVVEQLYDDVFAALDAAEADRDVRVVVLTGEGAYDGLYAVMGTDWDAIVGFVVSAPPPEVPTAP